jgi:hypothetical protein
MRIFFLISLVHIWNKNSGSVQTEVTKGSMLPEVCSCCNAHGQAIFETLSRVSVSLTSGPALRLGFVAAIQATNGKPGTPKAGGKPAPGAAAQPKHADTGKASAAKPVAPKAAPSAPPAAAKQELAPMAVLAAADLDEPASAAAAPQPKPKPSVRDALYNPKKVRADASQVHSKPNIGL